MLQLFVNQFTTGSWKRQTRTQTRTFLKSTFTLYNNYFSYLMLLLQQSSLPDPGVDLVIALIHI